MKLRKKFNKVTAWILTCILFFTMAFSITSEAYGEGYTHAKQFKNCHIYNGIDVSTWNKQIDWNAVKASGILHLSRSADEAGVQQEPYTMIPVHWRT